MSLSFPASPVANQVYQNWIFQNGAWQPNLQAMFVTSVDGVVGAVTQPGKRVLLMQQVVSATQVATVNFMVDFSTLGYDEFELDCFDLSPTVAGTFLSLRFSWDGTTFDSTTGYRTVSTSGNSQGVSPGFATNSSATAIPLTASLDPGSPVGSYIGESSIKFSMFNVANRNKYVRFLGTGHAANGFVWIGGGGAYAGAPAVVKGVQLFPNAGQIARGVFNLYGIIPGTTRAS